MRQPPVGKSRRPGLVLAGVILLAVFGCLWIVLEESGGDVGVTTERAAPAADDGEPALPDPLSLPVPSSPPVEVRAQRLEPEADSAAAPPPVAEPAGQPAPPPCALVVRVVFDDAWRTPAAGAWIDVGRMRDVPGAYDGSARVFERHQADDAGRLELATSCEPTSVSAWLEDEASKTSYFDLVDGRAHEVELVLGPCLRVEGRVVDVVTQRPIAGAQVRIPTFNAGDHAVTDDNGRYSYLRYPATENHGRSMQALAEGYGIAQRTIMLKTDGAWEVRGLDDFEAALEGATPPVLLDFELLPQIIYSGRVVDTAGRPVVGAAINARGYYATGAGVFSPDTAAADTDTDGSFHLAGLRADTAHTLWIRAPAFGTAQRHSFPATRTSGDLGVIVLHAASRLACTLTDPEGLPAEGFTVALHGSVPDPPLVPERSDLPGSIFAPYALEDEWVTDAMGSVRFEDLPADDYVIKVHSDRRGGNGTYVEEEVRLGRGEQRQVQLWLPADTVNLRGVVTCEGQRVPGAEVRAGTSHRAIGPVLTDASGAFCIAGQSPDDGSLLEVNWTDSSTGRRWQASLEVEALTSVTVELQPVDEQG